ncbi:hypothetical protein [Streptomyces radicis]|uniref:Uncharacterized protein n=1 Tax=Streptomyces radicis TaxID=1750517 RepID=A0A3A9WXS1_9ACTN|nr:hypothetical protein [Streptomyces radicis]RKN10977.1 hypothetical protein D7319_07540 [Streptomyces radicis]RKN25240.1 hypothetical protein D7318_08395 [Streptomyces radicis]
MSDQEPLNAQDAGNAQGGLADRRELAAMKESFAGIASARGLFGQVPGGDAAAAALESAALGLLDELEKSGTTVRDIMSDSGRVAELADEADEGAGASLTRYAENLHDLGQAMEGRHPTAPPGASLE